ncbi:MAG: hypothetical protein JNK15_01925 [Planctomycetes bacterium]|nr:hypothetical protein [Planctomycetota bacterium]
MVAIRLVVWYVLTAAIGAQELRIVQSGVSGTAAFDPLRQRVVLVGAEQYSREWDGTSWRRAPDRGSPAGFAWFDIQNARLAVMTRSGPLFPVLGLATRTADHWQSVPVTGGPGPLQAPSLVHDSTNNRVLLFGGIAVGIALSDETWAFDGSTWTHLQPVVRPQPRYNALLVYDSVRQRAVLFGGRNSALLNDTWEFDGTNWAPVATPSSPTPSWLAKAAHDPVRQRVVMLQSQTQFASVFEHWEYDGSTWQQLPQPPITLAFLNPDAFSLVHDPVHSETLVVSGSARGGQWAWNGVAWSARSGLGDAPRSVDDACHAASPAGMYRFGGRNLGAPTTTFNDELWVHGSNGWTLAAVGGPPPRRRATLWAQQGNVFLFGGETVVGGLLGDTWRWDGTAWSQVSSPTTPSPRAGAAVAYDSVADRAVLFSGTSLLADTWTFDGQQWQQMTTAVSPWARQDHTMAFDPSRNRTVLTSGRSSPSSSLLTDTWEWDGVIWQSTVSSAGAIAPQRIAFDSGAQQMLGVRPTGDILRYVGAGIGWVPYPVVGDSQSPPTVVGAQWHAVTGPTGRFTLVLNDRLAEIVQTPATVADYGSPCGPTQLQLSANGLPQLGDAGFALDLFAAPTSAPVAIAAAYAAGSVSLFGCTLLVDPDIATFFLSTAATGAVSWPLPVPAQPSLIGADLYFQGAALSNIAPNGFVLTAGVHLAIGL